MDLINPDPDALERDGTNYNIAQRGDSMPNTGVHERLVDKNQHAKKPWSMQLAPRVNPFENQGTVAVNLISLCFSVGGMG